MNRNAALPLLLGLAACAGQNINKEWGTFRDGFIEASLAANPEFAVYQGRHEYDGKVTDWSDAALAREIARLKTARDSATAFVPDKLDSASAFEREYLIAITNSSLFWLETADAPHKNPHYYSLNGDVYLTRPYASLDVRMKAFTAWAKAMPATLAQVRANLKPPMAKPLIDIGHSDFSGQADYLTNTVPGLFSEVKDSVLQAEFKAANSEAIAAFTETAKWLDAQHATETTDFALGAEKFSQMLLATEGVDVPLDRLMEVGRADLARNVAALKEACAAYDKGATIPECVAKSRTHKPEGGPVAEARRQLTMLEAFVKEKDLVSVPGTELAQVEESPPHMRWNSAYIDIPGPYEKGMPSIYYIAPADPKWSKAEQLEYIPGVTDLLFTSAHEVWPGHFLQFLHANRAPSMLGRLWVGYAYAEGWAHYAEEMMWEAGLGDGDPETHIGQLLNATLRNARFISAIGMHTGKMTQAESEALFHDEAFQDKATSKQQAARGTFDPAYLNYTLGKLMIRKLREDWTATRGGRDGWKAFHDAFLNFGGPPIPLVRKAMLGKDAGPAL